ncbi:restriction endonuclease subunit S [Magnetospirillum sp. SS-4]|uniref:restriction endonuclease subunit S n=1 Tax=Magnetospirillum sp. SS-4 TaxID=2681465 RepID=UPI00137C5AED|nr:restriction endonuclease subunit S [Magnetospirillum sp. SS-4]CAA7617439.1 Restriction modification system DNA specificity domain [Magnetospirillum sp. SS-4]
MRLERISDIAEQLRGVSYAKSDISMSPGEGFLPLLRANNVTDDGVEFDGLIYVNKKCVSQRQKLIIGDIVIAASSGSLSVVGKAAQLAANFNGTFGAFCKVIRPGPGVNARYLGHYFRTPAYRKKMSSLAAGANINNLRNEHIDDLEIPVPDINEQCRLAEILDRADDLRRKRRETLVMLDSLAQAVFFDLFGDPVLNPRNWDEDLCLGDVAELVSGITKGRKLNGSVTREVPYLAVANVQDKSLNLKAIKTIEATDDEIRRYRLMKDDLLLTEGGDPDKLGRGTLWNDAIEECIHQNHIFRVRLNSSRVHPIFLNWLVGSQRGKAYFLRSAKQTTGIASINMTQLRGFPLLVPPYPLQKKFADSISAIEKVKACHSAHSAAVNALFASLQDRAFRGEL